MNKFYLGDGVYVEGDGFAVTITTSDGVRDTNTIVFEPEVMQALIDWLRHVEHKSVKEQER